MDDALTPAQVVKLRQIKERLKNQEWHQAAVQLEQLYQERHDDDINQLLVEALYMDSQFKLAYDYAIEKQTAYLATMDRFKLMINVLLKSNHLITARQFALRAPQPAWQQQAVAGIEQFEQNASETLMQTHRATLRKFYHLGDQPFAQQRQRFEQAAQLPLKDYLTGARFLLRDPFTHPLVRASLLQSLQQLHFQGPLTFLWIDDQEHQIQGDDLKRIDEDPVYQHLMAILADRIGQVDPVETQMLTQELALQTMLAYPLLDHVFVQPEEWVTMLIKQYRGEDATAGISATAAHWLQTFSQILQTLM